MLARLTSKFQQICSFITSSGTPIDLTLDVLKLKRAPFVAATRGGLKLRVEPGAGESFTFYENLIRRDYIAPGINLKPGDVVIDVGANIGTFAILAGSLVGREGRVLAFEPVPGTYRRLVENVGINGFGWVDCRNGAVDARDGTLTLSVSSVSAYSSAHMAEHRSVDVAISPCWTLDTIFRDAAVDRVALLKVDCEGSEYGIFESLSPAGATRIDQISMEVHPVEGKSVDGLHERLKDLGFDVRPGYPWVAFNKRLAPV